MAQATPVHPTATRNAFHDRGSTAKIAGLARASDSGFSIAKLPQRRVNHMFRTRAAPEFGRLEGGSFRQLCKLLACLPKRRKRIEAGLPASALAAGDSEAAFDRENAAAA